MKRFINYLFLLCLSVLNHNLAFSSGESPYTGYFSGAGSGTLADPFQVSNTTQLDEVRNNLDAHYIQTADIDLDVSPYNTGAGWDPIGVLDTVFSGTYDGGGYTIASLFINTGDNYAGLFGMVDGATLKNLLLTDVDITGTWYAGALAGFAKNSTNISGCGSTGSVSGDYNIGGLVGESNNSTITGSFSTASAGGIQVIGGLAGYQNGTVTNCYARGAVDGTETIAGLVGHNAGTVENSYSTGAVSASTDLKGGLTWSNTSAYVTNSYWDTETSGQASSSGGTGKTTGIMQKQAFFIGAGWDFTDTWGYNAGENDGYPFLRFEGITHQPLFAGGNGTPGDPWQISTPVQLSDTRFLLDKHYILVADLDLGGDAPGGDFYNGGEGWEPLGSGSTDKFTGSLDGNGHNISNLFIDRGSDYYVGLYGYINGATITDLALTGTDVTGQTWTGGLAGIAYSATITNCSVSGEVNAASSAGGLVGSTIDGSLEDVTSSATVTTTGNTCGGIIGSTQGTSVAKAFFSGTVSGSGLVG